MFQRYMSPQSSGLALLAACFMLVSCLAYSSTLKVEAAYFFEMSFVCHRTIMFLSQKIELFIT
jgi:hypothetical protein